MSLYDRLNEDALHEYGAGIGSRIAGARHPHRIPLSNVSINKVKTPDQIKKAKRRAEKRAETRDYLRQVALGEGRRPLVVLGEAQLDLAKTKVMAKNLRKLWKDTKAPIQQHGMSLGSGAQWFEAYLKDLDEKGNVTTSASEFLVNAAQDIADHAEKKDLPQARIARKYADSAKRMHDLNVKQDKKDRAAARKAKKSKLNPADIKKFSYVWFFKGGKERSGKIMWIGPNKFKKGEKSYGVKVSGEPKLVYINLGHIYEAKPPAPPYKKQYDDDDDGDFWVDAGKDMAAELGYKPYKGFSKGAIKKHFGWK